jgi:hypothetical protein
MDLFFFLYRQLQRFLNVEFPPATLRNSNGIMQVPWEYTPQVRNYKQPADASLSIGRSALILEEIA